MPCNSDYYEEPGPTAKQKATQETAKNLCFVLERLGKYIPVSYSCVARNAFDTSAPLDGLVVKLCTEIRAMSDETREKIVYDAHDRDSRALADWWETHKAADEARLKKEAQAAEEEKRQRLLTFFVGLSEKSLSDIITLVESSSLSLEKV